MTDVLRELRNQRQALDAQIEELKEQLKVINQSILKELSANKIEEFLDGGFVVRKVQKTKSSYDWTAIKKEIGLIEWKKIVTEVPDEELLTKEIAEGNINLKKISKYLKRENFGAPYALIKKSNGEGVTE